MKVKCIYNIGNLYQTLTINKTYEVIRENDNWYWIINDKGKEDYYRRDWFKPTVAEIRNEKINKLLKYYEN